MKLKELGGQQFLDLIYLCNEFPDSWVEDFLRLMDAKPSRATIAEYLEFNNYIFRSDHEERYTIRSYILEHNHIPYNLSYYYEDQE